MELDGNQKGTRERRYHCFVFFDSWSSRRVQSFLVPLNLNLDRYRDTLMRWKIFWGFGKMSLAWDGGKRLDKPTRTAEHSSLPSRLETKSHNGGKNSTLHFEAERKALLTKHVVLFMLWYFMWKIGCRFWCSIGICLSRDFPIETLRREEGKLSRSKKYFPFPKKCEPRTSRKNLIKRSL